MRRDILRPRPITVPDQLKDVLAMTADLEKQFFAGAPCPRECRGVDLYHHDRPEAAEEAARASKAFELGPLDVALDEIAARQPGLRHIGVQRRHGAARRPSVFR